MDKKMQHRFIRIGAGILVYIITVIAGMQVQLGTNVELGLFLVAYLLISYDMIRKIGENFSARTFFDENTLIVIATVGALGIGKYVESIVVMLLFQIGMISEEITVRRSKKVITETLDIRPVYAIRKVRGREIQVDPSELKVKHIIIIRPGERVPVDAVITKGNTTLDTKAVTGEAVPRAALEGDKIYSGSINLSGAIEARVSKVYQDSTVAKIMKMVEEANERKSESELFITRFSKVYTPVIVMCALALMICMPYLTGTDIDDWVYRGLIFLVAACPCGLVLSIPIVFYGGIGAAAQRGILIKSGESMEQLSKADTFVFDKTGTLTKGVFEVQEVHPVGITEEELLEIAAHVESYTNHPIGLSLQRAYPLAVEQSRVKRIREEAGCGLGATFDGKRIHIGNEEMMERYKVKFDPVKKAGTVIYAAVNQKFAGYIVITDSVKEDAKPTLEYLKERLQAILVMLTGDTKSSGESVAKELGMDYAYTSLLPDEKVSYIEELLNGQEEHEKLVFVGDGINDAPVLARADVGIAMGALGTDAAVEAADIVLMEDELGKIVDAVKISKETMRVCGQNIWFAIGIKFLVLALSAAGFITMWEAICADVGVMILAIINAVWVVKYPA